MLQPFVRFRTQGSSDEWFAGCSVRRHFRANSRNYRHCYRRARARLFLSDRYPRSNQIDVEGYEPDLMAAFKDIALRYRPDFLIEVLPRTPEALEALDYLSNYERFLLTSKGSVRRSKLEVDQRYRDWLLQWPAARDR